MANPATALTKYLRESKEELEKVSWPTRKDTIRYSILVVVISVILAIYFGVLDWALNAAIAALLALYA